MSSINGSGSHEHRLEELAVLPAGEPLREALSLRVATASAEEQSHVAQMLAETDRLQGMVMSVGVPADLEEKLLRIPEESSRSSGTMRVGGMGWRLLAACLVVALGLLAYFFWPAGVRGGLNANLERQLAGYAVRGHADGMKLAFATNDVKAAEEKLNGSGLPFPVMVPKPVVKLDLEGGGTCEFGGTTAAYTRWKQEGLNYTLFQFDGKALGMPPRFQRVADLPKDLWQGEKHYQVLMWPGAEGKCAWVLVMETEKAVDPFQMY